MKKTCNYLGLDKFDHRVANCSSWVRGKWRQSRHFPLLILGCVSVVELVETHTPKQLQKLVKLRIACGK
jgi:hypothetical protein